MPKIFEYFGFIFLFYSNEHEPIHVHVMKDGHEAIFEIILENGELVEIHRRTSSKIPPLSEKDAATAEAFVKKYYKNIVDQMAALHHHFPLSPQNLGSEPPQPQEAIPFVPTNTVAPSTSIISKSPIVQVMSASGSISSKRSGMIPPSIQ